MSWTVLPMGEPTKDGRARFYTNSAAPLPLGYVKAIRRAGELRQKNPTAYSYKTISVVMEEYHGFKRSPGWWSERLREAGLAELRQNNPTWVRERLMAQMARPQSGR
jgi:hypothetical protein